MELSAFDKITIAKFNDHINARVIGITPESDGSKTYTVQPLRKDFTPSKSGSRLMRINSKEIENKTINLEKH